MVQNTNNIYGFKEPFWGFKKVEMDDYSWALRLTENDKLKVLLRLFTTEAQADRISLSNVDLKKKWIMFLTIGASKVSLFDNLLTIEFGTPQSQ